MSNISLPTALALCCAIPVMLFGMEKQNLKIRKNSTTKPMLLGIAIEQLHQRMDDLGKACEKDFEYLTERQKKIEGALTLMSMTSANQILQDLHAKVTTQEQQLQNQQKQIDQLSKEIRCFIDLFNQQNQLTCHIISDIIAPKSLTAQPPKK